MPKLRMMIIPSFGCWEVGREKLFRRRSWIVKTLGTLPEPWWPTAWDIWNKGFEDDPNSSGVELLS